MKKALKRHGAPATIVTDGLKFYRAAMTELGNVDKQEVGRHANNRVENSRLSFRRRERAMLRFRRMKTLKKFASVHANVHNQLASRPFGSTRNAISSVVRITSFAAQPPWPSGNPSWFSRSTISGSVRQPETSSHRTDSTRRSNAAGLFVRDLPTEPKSRV